MPVDHMPATLKHYIGKAGTVCRTCAACIIAGLWRRHSLSDVEARLAACPAGQQAVITGGVLLCLILLGFLAAQFGWIGVLVYWMSVILIIR